MQKAEERLQLQRVFGSDATSAQDFERPDFLLKTPDNSLLGIEVTNLYSSESDAKLKRLPGYSDSLLSRSRPVHQADMRTLRVDELTILNADGSIVDKVTGIVQKFRSPAETMNLLLQRIAEKESKFPEYQQSCNEADLIITDQSHLFHHESGERFYKIFQPLFPRKRLIASPFREIHLVTTTTFQKGIRIPLIANVFIADCLAYEHLLLPELDEGRPSNEILQLLAACLWQDGYTRVRVSSEGASTGFHCGAWELFYGEDVKAFRDWVIPHISYPGKKLKEVVNGISVELLDRAKKLTEEREKWFSSMDMRLATYEA
ncbi:hypothetical protein ACLBKS_02815 [Hylemonella sp. W303a]|uniref:hypothetical protein n=1 Tax=Hylemonella sp. W303a TaxID=3389873 RepID=UPI00396B137C